jgi:hypothetical protein
MKLSLLVSALLCASTAVAAPGTAMRRERARKRMEGRKSNPRLPVTSLFGGEIDKTAVVNTSHVQYSSNWAGAVLIGSGYKSVTGTIVVPTPKVPSGGSSSREYAASAWVGIDGDTCASAILQTGVDFYVQGGRVSFDAWYEWYPDYAYNFNGISINAGNTIKMTVTASSTGAGTATIQNLSNGQSVSHSFNGESNHLCETNAEWIVEDFQSGNQLVPFANFGTVTFSGASASTGSGSVGPSGATIIDIRQGNSVLTDCSASGSSVTCSYV